MCSHAISLLNYFKTVLVINLYLQHAFVKTAKSKLKLFFESDKLSTLIAPVVKPEDFAEVVLINSVPTNKEPTEKENKEDLHENIMEPTTEESVLTMADADNQSLYNYYGSDLTLAEDVAFIFPWNFAAVVIFLSGLIIYIGVYSKIPEELYRRLALQHLASGFIQVTCLTIYNLKFDMDFVNEMLDDAYGSLDLVITFTTACLAWVVFLRVFLFRNGEELYSLQQLTIFSTMSIAIIEAYEWLMSLVEESSSLLPALRLTSVLMIMSLPVVVFMLLVKSLLSSSSDVPKFQALFFMAYLLMFITSDVFLLRFNLHCKTSYMLLWTIFLYFRLVFEIVFYILFDRYLSHFFLN